MSVKRPGPKEAEKHLERAERAFERMKLREAARWYRQAVECDPGNVEALDGLGLALAMTGHVEEAIQAWERAARIHPDDPDLAYSLGSGYQQTGRLREAEVQFRLVLQHDPTSGEAAGRLADILEATDRPEEAAEYRRIAEQPSETPEQAVLASLAPHTREMLKRWDWVRQNSLVAFFIVVFLVLMALARDGGNLLSALREADWQWDQLTLLIKVVIAAPASVLGITAVAWVVSKVVLGRMARSASAAHGADEVLLSVALESSEEESRAEEARAEEEAREEAEARRAFADESRNAAAWWEREFSGGHLVWWVALAVVLVSAFLRADLPETVSVPVGGVLAFGAILKVVVGWLGWALIPRTGQTRRAFTRYYRWWGRGCLPAALALLPGVALWVLIKLFP